MPINLTPEQEAWCKAHVALGEFSSIEQAARQLIDERIAERERGREALFVAELSDAELDAIARVEIAPRHRILDKELD